jgi:PKD repeat protein
VYAFRSYQSSRSGQAWGFAWSPINFSLTTNPPAPPIPDFANKTASIGERLAMAIKASETVPEAACGPDSAWCAADVPGAAFNLGWTTFHTWTQPAASDVTATTAEDTPAEIQLAGFDPDQGETLSYEIVTQPLHGTAALSGNGVATYTPDANFNGEDAFTYRVGDGTLFSAPATVRVTVAPVNDAPSVNVDPAGPVDEAAAPIALTVHTSDVEGDPVTVAWSTDVGVVTAAGEFSADDGPAKATVTATADDGNGGISTASTSIDVRNVAPTADAVDTSATWGIPVTLNGTGTDPSQADAKQLTATWEFGDGTTGTGFSPSHVYADPGTYNATLTVHDKDGGSGSDAAAVTVGPRAASLAYAAPAGVNAAAPIVSARLGDETASGSARVGGHTVTFELGSTTCSAGTDAHGVASCTLGTTPALGPATLAMRFDGDAFYGAATTSAPVVVYDLPAEGAFSVGDLSAEGLVTFWSPSWWLSNRLSGGDAPASFKGHVVPSATGWWTTSPGFDHAPGTVPEWMGIVVTSTVTKTGSLIKGDTAGMIVVHVGAYEPALTGTGTVVAAAT